ncbi:unnamed protein product [Leuciscus chuanchicus]
MTMISTTKNLSYTELNTNRCSIPCASGRQTVAVHKAVSRQKTYPVKKIKRQIKCLSQTQATLLDPIKEDKTNPHPVTSREHLGAPAHSKPATEPSTSINIGIISSFPPVFPQARKMVSNSADLVAKVADPAFISIQVAQKKISPLRSPHPETTPKSIPVSEITDSVPKTETPDSVPKTETPNFVPKTEIPKSTPESEIPESVWYGPKLKDILEKMTDGERE